MKIKMILFVIFFASLLQAQVMGPKISVAQPDFNFGDIKQGGKVTHDFIVANTGGDSLVIFDVRPSCGCTAAKPEKNVLKPGESTKITAEFNTEGRRGEQQKFVYVMSNDPENPEIRLTFRANILTEKEVGSSRVSIGKTEQGPAKPSENSAKK